jgi:hypothetical protein
MRTALLMVVALALVLSASAVWAVVLTDDGLAGPTAGTSPNPDYVPQVGGNTVLNDWVEYAGGYTSTGVYDGDDYKWLLQSGSGGTIDVKALIEMWCTESLDATQVVFHQAGPGYSQSAYVGGSIQSNNGQYWGVSKGTWGQGDQNKADYLQFTKDVLRRTTTPNTPTLPISWALSDDGGSTYNAGSWDGGNNATNWGYWWLLSSGATGNIPFTLRITIDPSTYQDDGIYDLDPNIVVQPAL